MIMDSKPLLEKTHVRRIRKVVRKLRAFLLQNSLEYIGQEVQTEGGEDEPMEGSPRARTGENHELSKKRFVYNVFNVYIPVIKVLEVENSTRKPHRDLPLYQRLVRIVNSNMFLRIIRELANQEDELILALPDEEEMKRILNNVIYR